MSRKPRTRRANGRSGFILVLAVAAWIRPTPAYPGGGPDRTPNEAVLQRFSRLDEHMAPAEWEQEYPFVRRAIDQVFERNGWTGEADRFAHDLACEVAAVPPSQVMRRLTLVNERITHRYGLRQEQAARFRGAVMREAAGFLMRHAGVILEQTRDVMQARARGEPITREQVARWTTEGRPLIVDLRQGAERLSKTLQPMLSPDKRALLERDLESFDKRKRYVDDMSDRWARGEWQPADWGLDGDPVQGGLRRAGPQRPDDAVRRNAAPGSRRQPSKFPKWLAYEPSTWFAYVLELRERFDLDAGQMTTAESIHAELVERANQYAEIHADQLDAIATGQRATHEAFEPIRSLFRELQSRLDVIPTSSQRERQHRSTPGSPPRSRPRTGETHPKP